ncbi:hypothetical protein PHPALM_29964 [Phytophthora palmivora]|uniref:Uncharacterized protein n=1 Tax=Phytophthora palmivora TaxID=4796 RepID=A0A2P4X6B5_9STRA|nr:hypothetical protein PHPALM_29964 [Phytophthora palmivora]
MERLVVELEDQKYWNGSAPAIDEWRSRWEVDQEMRKAAQDALEDTFRNEAGMDNRIARLDLVQASYEACGSTEHCIAQFAEQNANPKYAEFYCQNDEEDSACKGVELDDDLREFGETRNHLCHDRNGTGLDTVSHERFQSLCRKINSIITSISLIMRMILPQLDVTTKFNKLAQDVETTDKELLATIMK